MTGTLPESPPDSGSEPPYSPTDLHAINNLNQIAYHPHHYPTNSQPANSHQLDQAMHVNETTNVECHAGNIVNGNNNTTSSIHKTEDILLSSAAMPLSNSVTNMMLPGNDMMMHQNVRVFFFFGFFKHFDRFIRVFVQYSIEIHFDTFRHSLYLVSESTILSILDEIT